MRCADLPGVAGLGSGFKVARAPHDVPPVSAPDRHLRLVDGGSGIAAEDELSAFVRGVRRDLARLLRALQSSGRGLSRLPDPITTRLAHVDSVTARFLLDEAAGVDEAGVESAAVSMQSIGRWIVDQFSSRELAQLRAHEMTVCIQDDELVHPLVCTSWVTQGLDEGLDEGLGGEAAAESQRLRHGLASLDDAMLRALCLRLGVRVEAPPWTTDGDPGMGSLRLAAEQQVLQTLADAHLLAILIATLPGEAHRLLAELVRGQLDDATLRQLARVRDTVRSEPTPAPLRLVSDTPADQLRSCALAFANGSDGRLWVPVELHRQIDGVLRAFGV